MSGENFHLRARCLMSPSHGPLFSVRLIRDKLCLLWFPPQVLADAVSHLVVDKFSELTDNFTSPHARRKVLAGVVMTTGDSLFRGSALVKRRGWVDSRRMLDESRATALDITLLNLCFQFLVSNASFCWKLNLDYSLQHFIWSKSGIFLAFLRCFPWLSIR